MELFPIIGVCNYLNQKIDKGMHNYVSHLICIEVDREFAKKISNLMLLLATYLGCVWFCFS